MSYAAFKMAHGPTGVEHCAAGFITHSLTEAPPALTSFDVDMDAEGEGEDWAVPPKKKALTPIPNLVIAKANVLEVYIVRVQEEDKRAVPAAEAPKRAATMAGICGASLEVVCHYRLHGNVESMAILSPSHEDGRRKRDAIVLSFQDAKIAVMEFDDSVHGLRTSSMHYFEGPEWQYLKRGREKFARGPIVQADPQGRCGGVLLYDSQMIILKAAQAGYGLVGDDESSGTGGTVSVHIESSYVVGLGDLDIKHVKDFTFIHGYIEPVIAILHEMEPTWAGRLAWKHHTCTISAHSVSMTLKQHPLIWSASNLPHDAYRLLAVPSPIGGVIVICANSLHYHSQSVSCALALNDFAVTTDSPEMPRSNIDVELDAAHATWISNDVALLSTKTGNLLLLSLVYDGRAVQRLELSKSKASVLASCISTVGDAFFFLGSRLGDSLLVQYNCGTQSSSVSLRSSKAEIGDMDGEAPTAKRLRQAPSDISQDVAGGEELSLYNSAPNNSDSLQQKAFSFAVRDSLVNVGPLKDFISGVRTNADPSATGVAKQSNYELVCCSGHGKNGSLCVLQQSIRPELITEVELPGCKGIWTVYHKGLRSHASDSSRVSTDEDEFHAYLIISLESRTMVLETAETLGEVTESVDYYVDGCTISAGNLFGRRRVVQVYARGIRILDGAYMTQDLCIEVPNADTSSHSDSFFVSTVSIADPYILLKMSDGSIQLVVGDPAACTVSITLPPISKSSADPIAACSLYHDRGPELWLRKTSSDAWLSTGTADDLVGTDGSQEQGDIYCIICRESGRLDLFEVPNFRCVYSIDKFMSGKSILVDTYLPDVPNDTQGTSKEQPEVTSEGNKKETGHKMKVVEICMQRLSAQFGRPFLSAILSDGTMLCYHAYFYEGQDNTAKTEVTSTGESATNSNSTSRLRNLRFVRVCLESMTREEAGTVVSGQRIVNFKNIGGYQGAFLTGARPAWFMVCRERLRVHPQLCHGSIVAFTPLHNINCKHGLIYVTAQGFLKICQLPSLNYDNYWPVKKIPLRGTPHQITYFADSNLYALIISFPVSRPVNQVLPSLVDQDISHQTDADNIISEDVQKSYVVDEFEVRILQPSKSGGLWEAKASIKMQTSENAIAVRMVTLLNTSTKENETFLAIGTAYVQGEDVAGRGRIILASICQDLKNPDTLVNEVYSKELKGAISALASLQGHLLIAAGARIVPHQWNGVELIGLAFYDGPHCVVSLNIVKTFILFGDIHKSIYFLNWKEEGSQLTLLAKDFGSLNCYATEFLIDASTLSLVVSDDQKNTQIFHYAPKSMESWKGQKLLPRAEFHVGAHVTKFLRLQMLPTSLSERPNRYALLCGTLDGSIGCIAPLDELTFRRLQTLQRKLVDAVPHVGGLNPRAFRQFRSDGKAHRPGPDTIVDCELLRYYEMLPLEDQLEIAHQIGTTRSQILNNLNDLSIATSFL